LITVLISAVDLGVDFGGCRLRGGMPQAGGGVHFTV
jgi:hypothetical protein